MPKILFRADADVKSGTGDLISLIYLSEYFKGWKRYFVTKDTPVARKLLQRANQDKVMYIEPGAKKGKEIALINSFVKENNIDIFFLEMVKSSLGPYSHVDVPFRGCIDFFGKVPREFDMVINWDVEAGRLYDAKGQPDTLFLLGPRYVILKKEIIKEANRLKMKLIKDKGIKEILISFGGFDEFNFTLKIIKALQDIDDTLSLNVILGAGYRHKKRLINFLRKSTFTNFKIRENILDMSRQFLKADLAVISGGLSLFEAITLKVPAAVIATYRHQVKRCRFFKKKGVIEYLGFRRFDKNALKRAMMNKRFSYLKERYAALEIPRTVGQMFRKRGGDEIRRH